MDVSHRQLDYISSSQKEKYKEHNSILY